MPDLVTALDQPFDEAVRYFRDRARVPTKHWTDVWQTGHARGFMVAGATSDELLKDLHGAVLKGIQNGTTLETFRKDFDSIVAKHGWQHHGSAGWRARVIYETNLNTAYAAGRWAQQTDPDVLEAYPYLCYQHSGSAHPRLQHRAWDGLTLRADSPFWDAHYPPNGWHCGCRAVSVSEGGLRRMGKTKPDQAPPTVMREWRNPHTGEIHRVPEGIDPGFAWNPGKAWEQHLKGMPLRAAPLRPVLPPKGEIAQAMAHWLEAPEGNVPAGHATETMRKLLGTKQDGVLLSESTLEKQRVRHPDLVAEDYLRLPEILAKPARLLWGSGDTVIAWGGPEERAIAVAVKGVGQDKNFVETVYPAWKKRVRAWLLRRSEKLAAVRGAIGKLEAAIEDAARLEDDADE